MEDDLLVTNEYISDATTDINTNINLNSFDKYRKAHEKYPNTYTDGETIGELTDELTDELTMDDLRQQESILENPKPILGLQKREMRFRRSKITIDSRNREKVDRVISELVGNLSDKSWICQSTYQSLDLLIYRPNHGFQPKDEGVTQIYISGLDKTSSYFDIGINRSILEYNKTLNSPIFTIKKVVIDLDSNGNKIQSASTGLYSSSLFKISLPDIVDKVYIKTATFGGNLANIYKITNFIHGYNLPSHYKIDLGRTYKNVYMVKLISIEIPITSYTINSVKRTTTFDGLDLETKINAKIKWITEKNVHRTFNLSLYSDRVFLNSFNLLTFQNNFSSDPSQNQINYNNDIMNYYVTATNSLGGADNKLVNSYNKISKEDRSHFDYYAPWWLDLTEYELTHSVAPSTSTKYWLPNSYHRMGRSLLFDIDQNVQSGDTTSDINTLLNVELKKNNPYYFNYYNLIRNATLNSEIDFGNSSTFYLREIFLTSVHKTNSTNIPDYMGFWIFDNSNKVGENDTILANEYIEIEQLPYGEYIFPVVAEHTEKLYAPALMPGSFERDNNISLQLETRRPIYEVTLKDGKYTKTQFIDILEKTLSDTFTLGLNGYDKFFRRDLDRVTENYNNENLFHTSFRVNIDQNLNLIDIRQYTKIKEYENSYSFNPNFIYYNEGIPYINLKIYGHQLNTGDRIYLENISSFENISASEINKEHTVYVMPAYRAYVRIIYPLPNKVYLDTDEFFDDEIGVDITINDQFLAEKLKRDLKKFCLPNDTFQSTDYNYNGDGNAKNQFGRSKHSEKEKYPATYDSVKTNRTYGNYTDITSTSPLLKYPFGIFYGNNDFSYLSGRDKLIQPYPTSKLNLDEESLIINVPKNKLLEELKYESNTLHSNMNYFGSKLINSANNKFMYPEKYNQFNKNEIDTRGIQISLQENETFVKLDEINSIDYTTSIGRITKIYNNSRPNKNGNYSFIFDLLSDTTFEIGDVIVGLESNCIAIIVPESWDYDGIPGDEIFKKGFGTYLMERYSNFSPFDKILAVSETEMLTFTNKYNKWEMEKMINSQDGIYIRIGTNPSNTNLIGINTPKAVIYKPIKYKFLFDEDTSPIDKLNIPINQEFSYSQTNYENYNIANIKESYLMGLYNNISSNYLILETYELIEFEKNDVVYIKNHKLFNRNRDNLKKKVLNIQRVEPFRNYMEHILEIFINLPVSYKTIVTTNDLPFENVNHIYDYTNNEYLYHLGDNPNLFKTFGYTDSGSNTVFDPYVKFDSSENNKNFGFQDRLINWFFENKYKWNANNIEKVLEFENEYTNNLSKKYIIIKLIVCPLDSAGKNFTQTMADKNTVTDTNTGDIDGGDYIREAPYSDPSTAKTVKRNSENICPFLPGMGVYFWESETIGEPKIVPRLIGYVLDTSLESVKSYIEDYKVPSYNTNQSVFGIEITNVGILYQNPPTVTIAASSSGGQATAVSVLTSLGSINEIIVTGGGFGYDPDNPPTVTIDAPVDTNGTQATAIAHVGQFGPTYAMYVLVNEDSVLFQSDTYDNQASLNQTHIAKIARGVDIYYNFNHIIIGTMTAGNTLDSTRSSSIDNYYNGWNIKILSGEGEGLVGVIDTYSSSTFVITTKAPTTITSSTTDSTSQYMIYVESSDVNDNGSVIYDSSTFGNYSWQNRRAGATIYQGSLYDYDASLYHLVSGHLEYFYGKYLQNKCIVHYTQNFTNEEIEFFTNHQIVIENKELYKTGHYDGNNYNMTELADSQFIGFENRKTEFNLDVVSFHSFDISDKVYIFDHIKSVNKYNTFNLSNPENVSELQTSTSTFSTNNNNSYVKGNIGIENICCDVITNLWNGVYDDHLIVNNTKPGKCVMIDYDFTEQVEKGFLNKGFMRVEGYRVPICGNNNIYHNYELDADIRHECQASVRNGTTRGSTNIQLKNSKDKTNSFSVLFGVNDVIAINIKIRSKTDVFKSINQLISLRSVLETQELNVITAITHYSSYTSITLQQPLLNDHIDGENVVARYKYVETYADISSSDVQTVQIKRELNGVDIVNEEYLEVGDAICIDWANQRYVDFDENGVKGDNIIPPYDLLTSTDAGSKLMWTQQFNRVTAITDDTNNDYIEITLEKKPFTYYPANTPIIIFKKGNPKLSAPNSSDSDYVSEYYTDTVYKKSLKYSNLATQPFTVNGKWYTKIFYKGHPSITPTFTDDGSKVYFGNNKQNEFEQGTKLFNTLTSKDIYIYGMKGVDLPQMPIPSSQTNSILDAHLTAATALDSTSVYNSISVVTPVIDGKYRIKPPIKEDFRNYVERNQYIIDIPGTFKYNYDYLKDYEYVSGSSDAINDLTTNYENFSPELVWDDAVKTGITTPITVTDVPYDSANNIHYHYVVIEGIYMGYGGYITEQHDEDDNIVNSVDGYKILEVSNISGNKYKLMINLEERELNFNFTKHISNKRLYTNSTNRVDTLPPGIIDRNTQFELARDDFFKGSIVVGHGGTICKKRLNAPVNLEGDSYIYLCIPSFKHLDSTANPTINNAFAKILLPGETNKTAYNSYVGGTKIFDTGEIDSLSEIEVAFLTHGRNLFDFNGLDHSFTIEIYEIIDRN